MRRSGASQNGARRVRTKLITTPIPAILGRAARKPAQISANGSGTLRQVVHGKGAILPAARIFRNLRRFAKKKLLRVAFERADRLIDFFERLAAVGRQSLILAKPAASEAGDIRADRLDLGIEVFGRLLDRFGR